jgi:hypothetical protein
VGNNLIFVSLIKGIVKFPARLRPVNSSLKSIVLESEVHHTEAILVCSSELLSPFIKIARDHSWDVDNSNVAEI